MKVEVEEMEVEMEVVKVEEMEVVKVEEMEAGLAEVAEVAEVAVAKAAGRWARRDQSTCRRHRRCSACSRPIVPPL